jgi:hypothetical protein
MIISTFENENRASNVCRQQGKWVVMLYEGDDYIKTEHADNEYSAEEIAENWVFMGD